MDYPKIDGLLLKIKSAYDSIGAETELVVEEPASIAEVEAIENRLERKLPLQIREFFLQYSKNVSFQHFYQMILNYQVNWMKFFLRDF